MDVDVEEILSESEEKLIPLLVDYLNDQIGESSAVSAGDICNFLNEFILWDGSFTPKFKAMPVRLRKLMHVICLRRLTSRPLLAGSNGYYVSSDPLVIKNYVTSLSNRIKSITNRLESVKAWSGII